MDGALPVALDPGLAASLWLAPLVAGLVAFVSAPVGVSGAFLLVPFQVSVLGLGGPSVSATNLVYNLVAIPAAVHRYHVEGRVLWSLAGVIVTGSVPGVALGWYARVNWLADALAFKRFVAVVLLLLAARLAAGLWQRRPGTAPAPDLAPVTGERGERAAPPRARGAAPPGRRPGPRTLAIALIAFVVAVVGTAYGVGGGALMVPLLVSLFGLPVYAIAGATLVSTLVTSLAGVLAYAALPAPPGVASGPDWSLGLLLGAGGMVGGYLGARQQRHLSARSLQALLAGIVGLVALAYGWDALPGAGRPG